jgi:IclR family transcriptional regulator, acetate operon repressor
MSVEPDGSPSVGRSYGRVLAILELFAQSPRPRQLSELSRELQVPKTTVSLLVRHLVARRYLETTATRSIAPGPAMLMLGARLMGNARGPGSVRMVIEGVCADTGLDIYLAVMAGPDVFYVDRVQGRESVRLEVTLGEPRPLHCTAAGKLALAYGGDEPWAALRALGPLHRYTDRTITDLDALTEQVGGCRARGYAVAVGELLEGIMSVAVPVWRDGTAASFITASGHVQFVYERQSRIVERLQEAAELLSVAASRSAAAT